MEGLSTSQPSDKMTSSRAAMFLNGPEITHQTHKTHRRQLLPFPEARQQLRGRLEFGGKKLTKLNVLFLCTHNSARSIIAECIINRLGASRFKGYSAVATGAALRLCPVHPYALDILKQLNYNTTNLRSKSWEEYAAQGAPALDFVFTVCDSAANEVCPVWPGQPISAHWGLPDPSAVVGTESERRLAFADTHRMLYQRIGIFTALPLESLDKVSLQKRLDDIGRAKRISPEPAK
jgi:arsenate reductase (thioredoxin)